MRVFQRDKHINVDFVEGKLATQVEMEDSFHHFRVEVVFSCPALEILEVRGEVVRVPQPECRPAIALLPRVVGLKVERGFNRALMRELSGSNGCFHLANLVGEAALAAVQGIYGAADQLFGRQVRALPRPERVRLWVSLKPGMVDSCLAWSRRSPMMQEAFPEGRDEAAAQGAPTA